MEKCPIVRASVNVDVNYTTQLQLSAKAVLLTDVSCEGFNLSRFFLLSAHEGMKMAKTLTMFVYMQ